MPKPISTCILYKNTMFRPKSRGRVMLRSSNPYDKPIFYAGYFTHPDDMKVYIKVVSYYFFLKGLSNEN